MEKMLKVTFKTCLLLSFILALLFCLYIGNVAITHNSMEEYCQYITETECNIVWSNLLPLLSFWFFIIFASSLIILLIFSAIIRKVSKRI